MAKHLISFLGTGRIDENNKASRTYNEATYVIDDKEYPNYRFVSACLVEHFNFDSLILVGTAKSMWEEVYRYFVEKENKTLDDDIWLNLAEIGGNSNHKNYSVTDNEKIKTIFKEHFKEEIIPIIIPYGLNKEEQIEIFKIITQTLKNLKPNDEITLDITHSFRSLPMYVTSCINYVNEVLDNPIKLEKVYYGMFDIASENDGKVPIVDISTTLELNEWATATHSFKEYGKGYALADLLQEQNAKQIKEFSDVISINYLSEISSKLTKLKQFSEQEFTNEFAKMIIPNIVGEFAKKLVQSVGNSQSLFQYNLAVWHYDHHNYSSAYIVFVEAIITFVCEKEGLNWKRYDHREEAKNKIKQPHYSDIFDAYKEANKIRNRTAHNLPKQKYEKTVSVDNDIRNFKKLKNEFYKKIKKY